MSMMAIPRTIAAAKNQNRKRKERHISEWEQYFRQCWRSSTCDLEFEKAARLKLALRFPLSGHNLFEAWARHASHESWITHQTKSYLGVLLRAGLLTETDIIKAVARRLPQVFAKEISGTPSTASNPDATAFEYLAARTLQKIQADKGKSKKTPLSRSMRLLQLIGAYTGAAEATVEALRGPALMLGNAMSNYLVAHVNQLSASGILVVERGDPPKLLRKAFSRVVPRFRQVLENAGSPCKEFLAVLQQQSKLQDEVDSEPHINSTDLVGSVSFQQEVANIPVTPARAALFAYLSTLLTGRPKADDTNLRTFLDARYQADVSSLIVDIIVTSFRALAAAKERKDNAETESVHRSFIANKLPLLLEEYAPLLFGEKPVGHYIGVALRQVDEIDKETPVLQPRTDSDPKQRFLLASALTGLIQESQIPSFLGYSPTQGLPAAGRYNKDELVRQCQADSKRIDQLVKEMSSFEGNTGNIARALLELIRILCASKETMTLKTVCHAFLKRPYILNYMFLFAEPRQLLRPLCQLLDNWPTEDPSVEQHHGYEEFGGILLFVMVCKHRYELPISAFARDSPDSFILTILQRGFLPKTMDELTDTEKQHFKGWITSLFETNSITDETLTNCTPKEFYSLVATLVDQSLMACQAGILSIEALKAGLEFLYEPWLVPSLLPVLSLFSSRLFGIQAEAPQLDFLMRILSILVKPPKLQPEASVIHQQLLPLVALPLARGLHHVKRFHPRRSDVQMLSDIVIKHARLPATNTIATTAMSSLLLSTGGLEKAVASGFDDLVKFNAGGKDKQAKYDHRTMYQAITFIGAKRALRVLLDQVWPHLGNLKQQSAMIDLMTGIIAANSTDVPDGHMSLKEALQLAVTEANILAKRHRAKAEFLVRLERRVEAHCAKPAEETPPEAAVIDEGGTGVADVGLDTNTVIAAVTAATEGTAAGGEDLMLGIDQSVALTDSSQLGQVMDGSMDMSAITDIGINNFIDDLDMLNGQSVDDIFASL